MASKPQKNSEIRKFLVKVIRVNFTMIVSGSEYIFTDWAVTDTNLRRRA